MATLSVLKFGTPEGAEQALTSLVELQKQRLILILDAAVVSWAEGKKKPTTRQAFYPAAAGALSGAFWGLLFGMLFFIPFMGMAMGAVLGGLTGKMRDYGIDDGFVTKIKAHVREGSSALFVLSGGEVPDKVIDAMKNWPKFEFLTTNLSAEQEATLRAEFGEA